MSDPGDLIGLMHKNEKTGHSEFLPPYWWPLENEPIVLFLDELNRARPEILQSVMNLLKYIKYLKKRKMQEAMAHFTSLLESSQNKKALAFIFAKSEAIVKEVSEYIQNIEL